MSDPLTNGGQYDVEANFRFNAKEYLKRFVDPTGDPMRVHTKFLSAWHQFYDKYVSGSSSGGDSKKRLLEFGGGPTLYSLITASKYVESITFADYAESNRNEITMWKERACGAHDWSKYIEYVVSVLEGNADEKAPVIREQLIREKILDVVKCNIRSEEFLDRESQFTEFDFIHTNLCLEIACKTKEEFDHCIASLGKLLKPGGYLVCLTAKGGAWYTCAGSGKKLFQLKMEEEDIIDAFKKSGLSLIESYDIDPRQNPLSATKSFQFTIMQKK